MKKYFAVWILVLALGMVCAELSWAEGDRVADAKAFVQAVQGGRYAEAVSQFDATMTAVMPASKLEETWQLVTKQFGSFAGISTTRTSKKGDYDVVQFPTSFGSTALDIWIVYDQSGRISGLWILNPTQGGLPANIEQALSPKSAEPQYKVPEYVHPERFDEYPVFVNEAGDWELPGTLTMPKGEGPFPIVILVHGSGPNDRDETLGPNKPFKDIAWGLATRGIAVVRYDKRTKVHGLKIAKLDNLTPKEEVVDDAVAAVALARGLQRIDPKRVYVLGHSLGGLLAPRIGKADPEIAGLIVLAGPTRPMEDIVLEQLTYIASLRKTLTDDDKKEIEKARQQVAAVKALKSSTKSSAASLLLGVPVSYWLDLRASSPTETAKSLKQPMLILQGGRDYQVTEVDLGNWKAALSSRANVTFKLYPDLNHLFITGTGKATPSEYEQPGTVEQSVVRDISDWINAQQDSATAK